MFTGQTHSPDIMELGATPSTTRPRCATTVQDSAFATGAGARELEFKISLRARWLALVSALSSRWLNVNDTPEADTKSQVSNACSNVGLMSALLLSIAIGMMFDAMPNASGLIDTDPLWVGEAYFVSLVCSVFLYMYSTLLAILIILLVGQLDDGDEAWYFSQAAGSEVMCVFGLFVGATTMVSFSAGFWLVIMTCGVKTEEALPGRTAGVYLGAFYGSLAVVVALTVGGLWVGTSLLAKLHKTKYKFAPHLADARMRRAKAGKGFSARLGDAARFSLYALGKSGSESGAAGTFSLPARRDPALYLQLGHEEAWRLVCAYFEGAVAAHNADPADFLHYVLANADAQEGRLLAHAQKALVSAVFEAKLALVQRAELRTFERTRLAQLRRSDPRFRDFPADLLDDGGGSGAAAEPAQAEAAANRASVDITPRL